MSVITDVRCVLTQEALDAFCKTFYIPEEVHPVLPNQVALFHLPCRYTEAFLNQHIPNLCYWGDQDDFACPASFSWHTAKHIWTFFAFINALDPTKVRVVERERDDEPRLLETAVGRIVPLLLVAQDRADSELGASVDRLFDEGDSGHQTEQGDFARGGQDVTIQPAVEAADTIAEEAALVRSRRLRRRKSVVVDAEGPHPPKTEGGSWNPESSAPIMTTITTITPTVDPTFATKEKVVDITLFSVGSSSAGGTDPITGVFSDLIGSYFLIGDIRTIINPDTDLQKTYFNVRATRKMYLSAEVRMHDEYNIKEKRRLKCVVDDQGELLKAREKEIENLKVQLSLREAEAAKAIHLRAQASELETMERFLRDEANDLKERNAILKKEWDALDVKVAELETSVACKERGLTDLNALSLCTRIVWSSLEKFQDDRMKFVNDKFDKLYSDFVEMALHLEEKFYPHLLTIIFGREWLLTHGMELAIVKCLNSPEYISVLGIAIGKAIEKGMQDGLAARITHGKEGRNVNFLLLAELKSNKDSSVETIMEILHLENFVAEKLGLNELQPNVGQLMVPIHYSPDHVVVGATALSLALDTSSSRIQKIRENIANQRSVQRDVFVSLAEPFSSAVLMGVEVTLDAMLATTTALSTTLASTSAVDPISIYDYEVVDADDQAVAGENVASFPNVDDAELHIPQ
nr:hypothetical protein [Tanacetum cinerariifolium]